MQLTFLFDPLPLERQRKKVRKNVKKASNVYNIRFYALIKNN